MTIKHEDSPAIASIAVLFFMLGIVYATWASRIPAIREGLHLSASDLGMVLLCSGAGAVVSFPFASGFIARFGVQRTAACTAVMLIALLVGSAQAPTMPALMVVMVALGVFQTSFNVSINALGSGLELVLGRSVLASLHAWYCVGCILGALVGSLLAGSNIGASVHFWMIGAALVLLLAFSVTRMPRDLPQRARDTRGYMLPHGPLIALGIICFLVAISEGVVTDWSSIYMHDQLSSLESEAPLAYAAFSTTMFIGRLRADRLKDRYGTRMVIVFGALLATFGVCLVVASTNLVLAIIGFSLVGAGLAPVFPFVFSAAGRRGPNGLASVATMGYSGILVGPPIIGFVAHSFGLPAAFLILGSIVLLISVVAAWATWSD